MTTKTLLVCELSIEEIVEASLFHLEDSNRKINIVCHRKSNF